MIFWRVLAFLVLAFALLIGRGYWNATRDPIVRTASVHVKDWRKGAPPITALLISDIHIAGPDMPPERVMRIARGLNALKPDIVLIAGDLVSEKTLATRLYSRAEVVAPLKAFAAPLGVVIAMGNHDHWFDEAGMSGEITKAGLTVLRNEAIVRGPLVIGGVDDDYTHHADLARTYAAMDKLSGVRIILTHSPDIIPDLPAPVAAVFAGHTHCGQILRPFSGKPLSSVTRYGDRFQCGDITDKGQRVFVTAGLGTSVIWLRYGALPDAWLVTLGP
jgi:uncharacterized protein